MSAETTFKLLSRANGDNTPTPSKIQQYLDKSETFTQVNIQLIPGIPPEIVALFLSRRRGYDGERLKRFKDGLTKAKECYGEKGLAALTSKCIRKNGTINFGRLRKTLKAQQHQK